MSEEYVTIDSLVAEWPVSDLWNTALTAGAIYTVIGEGELPAFKVFPNGLRMRWDQYDLEAAHGQLRVKDSDARRIVEAAIAARLSKVETGR